MTRTKFASDHKGKKLKEAPGVNFDTIQTVDVTEEVLHDPRLVPPNERQPVQRALTMLQYLRAVVPPTIVHSEIAPDRIAGHLINAWDGMVGEDLAKRFPALAALNFLANDRIPIATDADLRKSLARMQNIVIQETGVERQRLEDSLLNIAAIIRQSKLQRQEIANSAFYLVGSGSTVIGGDAETRKHISGILKSQSFEMKLTRDFKTPSEAENFRLRLTTAVGESFKRLADGTSHGPGNVQDIQKAIDDEALTVAQTLEVASAAYPSLKYHEIKIEFSRGLLRDSYLRNAKRRSLTDDERVLIDNIGGRLYLPATVIPELIADVQFVASVLQQSREWQEQLIREQDNFIARGVNRNTIDLAIAQMSQRQNALLTAETSQALSTRAGQLQSTVKEFRERMAQQTHYHDVSAIVRRMFETDIIAVQDPLLKEKIIWAVLQDAKIDPTKHEEVTRWVSNFRDLDPDLRSETLAGNMTMAAAIRMKRRRRFAPPASVPIPDQQPAPPTAHIDIDKQPAAPVEPVADKENYVNRLRQEVIAAHLIPAMRLLATIDLHTRDVPADIKIIFGEAETALERLRSGHPDVVRVMDEDYPRLLQEIRQMREEQLQQLGEYATRDTRTGH